MRHPVSVGGGALTAPQETDHYYFGSEPRLGVFDQRSSSWIVVHLSIDYRNEHIRPNTSWKLVTVARWQYAQADRLTSVFSSF